MTRPRAIPARVLIAALITAALTTTACNVVTIGGPDMRPSITRDQATERADAYIAEVVAALTPTPTLTLVGRDKITCGQNPATDRISIGHRYFLDGLSTDRAQVNRYIDVLLDFWTSRGYRVHRDERPVALALVVKNPQDEFLIGVQTSQEGYLSIAVDSPCIWPNGTPDA